MMEKLRGGTGLDEHDMRDEDFEINSGEDVEDEGGEDPDFDSYAEDDSEEVGDVSFFLRRISLCVMHPCLPAGIILLETTRWIVLHEFMLILKLSP